MFLTLLTALGRTRQAHATAPTPARAAQTAVLDAAIAEASDASGAWVTVYAAGNGDLSFPWKRWLRGKSAADNPPAAPASPLPPPAHPIRSALSAARVALSAAAAPLARAFGRPPPGALHASFQPSGGGHLALRLDFDLPTDAGTALALGRELDLAPAWNHYVIDSGVSSRRSPTRLEAAATVWLPPPCQNRRLAFGAVLHDSMTEAERCVVVSLEPAATATDRGDSTSVGCDAPSTPVVAATLHPGSFLLLAPRQAGVTHGCLVLRLDPALPPLVGRAPTWLLRIILAVMAPSIYAKVVGLVVRIAALAAGGGSIPGGADEDAAAAYAARMRDDDAGTGRCGGQYRMLRARSDRAAACAAAACE